MDYKEAYYLLFNSITTGIETLESSKILSSEVFATIEILKNAQITTEQMYID